MKCALDELISTLRSNTERRVHTYCSFIFDVNTKLKKSIDVRVTADVVKNKNIYMLVLLVDI